jgi:hypothetical protein
VLRTRLIEQFPLATLSNGNYIKHDPNFFLCFAQILYILLGFYPPLKITITLGPIVQILWNFYWVPVRGPGKYLPSYRPSRPRIPDFHFISIKVYVQFSFVSGKKFSFFLSKLYSMHTVTNLPLVLESITNNHLSSQFRLRKRVCWRKESELFVSLYTVKGQPFIGDLVKMCN